MYNLIYWIERFKESFLMRYRKYAFLSRINSKEQSVKLLGKVYVNATNIVIGKNVTIYPNVYFWGDGTIVIGDNVDIGVGSIIFSKKQIKIGNNSSIAAQCYLIDSNHGIKKDIFINQQPIDFNDEGIVIGSDVWIAAGCKIIKGARINNGAIIGLIVKLKKMVLLSVYQLKLENTEFEI